jgi:hypothetical protein
MKFHGKNRLKIFLFILFIISMSSTGYDLYAHSIMYYFSSEFTTHSYIFFYDDLVLPRYFLLSYIYGFSRNLGIPIGWVAVVLCFIPSFKILASNGIINFKFKGILNLIILILVYFYSGLSLALLWLLAYFVTGKRFYLIGGLFHPVGIILVAMALMFNKKKITSSFIFILMLISFLSASFVFLKFNIFSNIIDVENIKFIVNFKSLIEIIIYTYESKSNEIHGLIIFVIIFMFKNPSGNIFSNMASKINYKIIMQTAMFLILLNSFTRDYNSLLCSAVYCKASDAIYVTWFDFGGVTPNLHYNSVLDSRYDKVEGFL